MLTLSITQQYKIYSRLFFSITEEYSPFTEEYSPFTEEYSPFKVRQNMV